MKPTLGPGVAIDVERLVSTRMLLTANSGAGKSWALRRLLEQTHGQVQQLVIDPEGEFYTLRERFPYVLAGKGGDCPAEPRSAALLARRLLELGTSAVLDLYELAPRDRVRFVRLFLESLIDAPRALWHPALVVIDEAHAYAPEKGHGEAESAEAVARLMAQGRKRGFAGVLATQRLSKLAKDVAAEANNLLIGRASLDVDLRRAGEALGLPKAEWNTLRALPAGSFYAFGPALTAEVTLVKVEAVSTAHPQAGARATKAPPPPEKVRAVLAKLADLPAEAAAEAKSAEELRAKVRELEKRLLQVGHQAATVLTKDDPEAMAQARERGRSDAAAAYRKELGAVVGQAEARGQRAARALDQALEAVKRAGDALREPIEVPELPEPTAVRWFVEKGRTVEHRVPVSRPQVRRENVNTPLAEGMTAPRQRILDSLLLLESVGIGQPSRTQLALWCDVSPTSGGYFNNLGALRSAGLIDYPTGGTVVLTDAGRAIARAVTPPTVLEMHELLFAKVSPARAAILRALIELYPSDIGRDELAERIEVSPTSGGYFNNLGALRTLGLIDYPSGGRVVALPVLFLE